MKTSPEKLTCPICGIAGPPEDFEQHPNNTGCWCPDCQTFIWYDPVINDQHNILLLEKPSQIQSEKGQNSTHYKFKKRLSPLRYPGGKSKLIDYLFTCLQALGPQARTERNPTKSGSWRGGNKLDTFVEVFAGGASFGLALLDAGVINHLILNDADKNLTTFWNEILHNPEPLIAKLNTVHPTHTDYNLAKEVLSQSGGVSPTERAWSNLLVNRLSYSGIQKAGPLGGKDGSEEELLVRYNPQTIIKQITHLASFKDKITLLNQDYTEVIQEYYWDEHSTLFIDPPLSLIV